MTVPWSDAEVLHLIEVWGEEGIQEQLEGSKRNKHVYEKIAKELSNKGSDKTAEQCRAKMKKLKLDYRKVKDEHSGTEESRSTWKFFDAMDTVLGHRPTTHPPVVLDTSDQPGTEEEEETQEEEEEDEEAVDQSSMSTPSGNSDEQSIPTKKATSHATGIKGRKRPRTKDEIIEAIMTKVVKASW